MQRTKHFIGRCFRYARRKLGEVKHWVKDVKFEGRYYHVNNKDKIRIEGIKLVLFVKRQCHRFMEIVWRDNRYTLSIVLAMWCVFVYASWLWGKHRFTVYQFTDAIWDNKTAFFTSVIIVTIGNIYTRISKHKQKLYLQHELYVNIMRSFDRGLFGKWIGSDILNYMVFYCEKTLEDTLHHLRIHPFEETIQIDDEYYLGLRLVKNALVKASNAFLNDKFVGVWEPTLITNRIQITIDILEEIMLERTMIFGDLHRISENLLYICDMMRCPWRWDINKKMKILEILSEYPNSWVNYSFYYTMLLSGHEFCNEVAQL